ncbi:hypothetical protein OROHE_007402 [Orobanche hederae]
MWTKIPWNFKRQNPCLFTVHIYRVSSKTHFHSPSPQI